MADVNASSLESMKALLKADHGGIGNAYDHLVTLVGQLVAHQKKGGGEFDPYDAVESLSRHIKEGKFQSSPPPDERIEDLNWDPKFQRHVETWTNNVVRFSQSPVGDDGEMIPLCSMPDVTRDLLTLKNATGIGFGDVMTYNIHCSMKRLAASTPGLENLRLWGTILGVEADYIIAEGQLSGADEGGDDVEPRGTGVNKFTYWATTDLMGSWVMLPDARPDDLVNARRIKKLFSGNLDRRVISHPWFGQTERHLLRCMIGLITSDTVICPSGMYKQPEEGEGVELDAEWEGPQAPAAADMAAWVHERERILINGKTSYPEVDEEAEPERFNEVNALKELDPPADLLRPIAEDEPVAGHESQWAVELKGDLSTYGAGESERSNAVAVLRNLRWPGAVTAYQGKTTINLYVGYGLRAGMPPFFPPAPEDVQSEPEDPEEHVEVSNEEAQSDGGDMDNADDDAPDAE